MASGDLKGHYNDIQFKSGAGGLLLYDFNSLEGSMSGEDISFVENGSAIRADRVVHDGKSGHTAFEGNVYVEYLN